MMSASATNPAKLVTVNRKARRDYHLHDRYEAGLALRGTEVKSIRAGKLSLADSYARIQDGEIFLIDAHIGLYDQGTGDQESKRRRKLLLRRQEINKIESKTRSAGMTIVPTKAYFSNGKVKLEIAVASGKREYDKRDIIEKEEARRAIRSHLW